VTAVEERWARRSGDGGGGDGGGRGEAVEEDAAIGESEVAENKRVGREKNRRNSVNDKLAPHVREDIGGEIFSFC